MKNPLPAIFGRLRQGGPDAFESGKDSPLGARTSRSSRAGGSSFPNHPHHRLARQIPGAAAAFMLLAPPVVPAAPDASATPGALTTPAASVVRPAPATHPASPIPPGGYSTKRRGAVRRALRSLPRSGPSRGCRPRPAAGQSQAAAPRCGGHGDRRGPARHPDAGLLRRPRPARRRDAGRSHLYAARDRAALRHGGDRAHPYRAPAAGHPGRRAGVRGRSPVPVHRRRAGRPPRHRA